MGTKQVRKGNTFIDEFYNRMTLPQENVFALALTKLNEKMMAQPRGEDGKLKTLDAEDLWVELDYDETKSIMMERYAEGRVKEFEKSLDDMQDGAKIIHRVGEWGKHKRSRFVVTPTIISDIKKGVIKIYFNTQLIEAYLDREFALYHLDELLALESKHSRSLYHLFQKECYRNEKTNAIGRPFKPSVQDIKNYLEIQVGSYYDNFHRLNSKILKPAIKEINEKTELQISQENVKRGRSVAWVDFHIVRRKVNSHILQQTIFGTETPIDEIPEPIDWEGKKPKSRGNQKWLDDMNEAYQNLTSNEKK